MKKNLIISLRLTIVMIILCAVLYPLLVAGIGKLSPGNGKGVTVTKNGIVVGYERLGQRFTNEKYFWGRPSAVDYNTAGSAGSNKGPSNEDYLKVVQTRIDSFLVHHPGIEKKDIPAEMVTASGSGLDPDISPESAFVQVTRVAKVRGIAESKIKSLVEQHIEKPIMFGPAKVNVLKLNVALDELK